MSINQIFIMSAKQVLTYTAQKMKFPIKDFSSKCDQIRRKPPLVEPEEIWKKTEEIPNAKLHFLCSLTNTTFS